ncbi:MAG: T9SS type A sorting domain-containing protein, partial [Bacteroidales bacterium]|nr:T9SS type A sorting domain-containing protein [Bacteroidales bacterium]
DKDAQVSVRIFDISGRNIATQNLGKRFAGENSQTIHCGNLATGIYFIQILSGDQTRNGKLVITK